MGGVRQRRRRASLRILSRTIRRLPPAVGRGQVIAVDLLRMEPNPDVKTIRTDFLSLSAEKYIDALLRSKHGPDRKAELSYCSTWLQTSRATTLRTWRPASLYIVSGMRPRPQLQRHRLVGHPKTDEYEQTVRLRGREVYAKRPWLCSPDPPSASSSSPIAMTTLATEARARSGCRSRMPSMSKNWQKSMLHGLYVLLSALKSLKSRALHHDHRGTGHELEGVDEG
ncbi:hypothetical protein OH76DRAFT_1102197 [Lentinus brumalis]|uniref:Uncharacterized protein n=1 Tax=Lentinus brumalis TaxID=2498619 RepID=A0A371CVL2_9APHY|nr:hypothetical protein OH76DRAFT_1102197 [Polyporus brumalis]